MAHYVGVDIIEIDRIDLAIGRWGKHFLDRIYTKSELSLCRNRAPALAARFAAKEAVMKLLDAGDKGVGWRDIETLAEPEGRPLVHLYGRARKQAERLGVSEIAISLSHSREFAIAYASALTS